MVRSPAGPDYRPPLSILLSHLLVGPGDLWEQLPTFVFSLLGPAGLIPGAGWVWEEDEDSWDSLAGGLLAWS